LPDDLQRSLETSSLLVAPQRPAAGDTELTTIRRAIRAEHKLRITYTDEKENNTQRTIWPIALGFFERIRVVAAWCETRRDYRHFRTDRIRSLKMTDSRYPRRRFDMLREWRTRENLPQ
jgi:predicted DNA-binding transcriptional regulator YafY